MSNLSSYCGLVDAKIRASDKDLPVKREPSFPIIKDNKIKRTSCLQDTPNAFDRD